METAAILVHNAILETLRVERAAVHERLGLVLRLHEEGLYRPLGYARLQDYARDVMDMGAAKLKSFLFLARQLPQSPALEEAVRSGELPWTKAVLVARVGTPATLSAWIRRAKEVSCRQLERQARASAPGDGPPHPDDVGPPRERRSWLLEAADARVADQVVALLRAQSGLDEADLEDARLVGLVFRRMARVLEDESAQPPTEPIWRSVSAKCPDCAQVSSPDHLVMDHQQSATEDDGETLDLTEGPDRGKVTRHVPARLRRAVLARDGYRCVFPGCTCDLWLHLHHGEPFARAPRHVEEDLFTVCSAHHTALHEGHVGLFQDASGNWLVVHKRGLVEAARVGLGDPSLRAHVRPGFTDRGRDAQSPDTQKSPSRSPSEQTTTGPWSKACPKTPSSRSTVDSADGS